jgi:serine/threonine-protein kinase
MSVIRRMSAAKHLWMLRRANSLQESALRDVKQKLVAQGPAGLASILELLPHPEARPHAEEILREILSNDTVGEFAALLSTVDSSAVAYIVELLSTSEKYDAALLLELFPSAQHKAKGSLESILQRRAKSIPLPKLAACLGDNIKESRSLVYRLLELNGDPSVAASLKRLLVNEDWWVRYHALTLIGKFPSGDAIEAVKPLLRDPNKTVRLEAVQTLGKLDAHSAIPELCESLRDENLKVHTAAIDVLIRFGDVRAVSHLIDVLKDESEYARRGAVEVLNQVATPDAVRDLVSALRDEDWWVRVRAADALGSLGGDKVVEAVLELLDNPDEFLRRYAVEILNTVPDQRSVAPLIRALADPDWWVRERSIDALAKTGDPRAVDPIMDLMLRDAEATPLCARALGALGDARAVEPLCELLESSSAEIRREARDALVLLSKCSFPSDTLGRIRQVLAGFSYRVTENPFSVHARRPLADPETGRPEHRKAKSDTLSMRAGSYLRETDTETKDPSPAVPASPVPLLRGDRIAADTMLLERYRVKRKIGSGGFGTVYLVQDTAVRDDVILKILSSHISEDETMIKRFIQELKFTRLIAHKNIIRIHDFLDLPGGHAISMEYFPSEDLASILRRIEKLECRRGVKIAAQICEGLAAAHAEGVIHRDIKPPNILVGQDDTVKIVDFGLASMAHQVGSRLTKSGILIGTPQYMAPEQITGEKIDPRTDLYSLGVMMYEMFTGLQPFRGDTAVSILFHHLEGEVPHPNTICADIPQELSDVVMLAMAKNRDNRPPTANDLLERLRSVAV